MEFVFLGTSSGIPTLQRNVTGLVIKHVNRKSWCLVDCGEGTQHQLLRTPYSLVQLSAIFITHVHGDHCYGLPGLLATAAMAGRNTSLKIYAPKGVEEFVRQTMRYTDMHMSYDLEFLRIESVQEVHVEEDFIVQPHALSHRVPSYGFSFIERVSDHNLNVNKLKEDGIPQGPLWGRIAKRENFTLEDGREIEAVNYLLPQRKGQRIIVGGDNDTPELLEESALKADVLIHESTYTQAVSDKVGPGPQHSSAKRVAELAEKVGLKNLVLTHFSARYHHPDESKSSSINEVKDEAENYYSGTLFLAQDFDHFRLSKEQQLQKVSDEQ